MKARYVSSVLAALAAALLLNAPAEAGDKAFDRSFSVQPGGRLSVKLDGGHIVVTGSDASQVAVHLRARGSDNDLEKLEWTAAKDADGVVVSAKRNKDRSLFGWMWNDVHVSATIEVPREYQVELATAGGNIELRQLNGNANGRTSGGHIVVENVNGNVQMRTSGGRVNVKSIDGPVQVHTSGGPIQASEIKGGLRAHTSGGRIHVEQTQGPIDVHTSGGSIDIDLAGENEGVNARTSGGSITLRMPATIRATLNASTSGGRVKSDFPVTTHESSDHSLRGTINGGGPEILARSSGGSILVARRE